MTGRAANDFNQRIDDALGDAQLQENFQDAMQFLRDKRAQVVDDETQWSDLRQAGAAIRREALANLPELLEQLEQQCESHGIKVHWAMDAAEANKIIIDLARQHKVRRVVKGKSMATEEIGLNAAFEQAGIEALESDMGEYIVQLANETPSHIIMPAIHKRQIDIHQLFEQQLGETGDPNDVDRLIGVGRKILRQKFKHADMGISGVNFAAADTGTLCLVENEGNGRLSTTAPPVHVAVMGIEKVIPRLSDLPTLLSLLTRSATGQTITTYVNLIHGPRHHHERQSEIDGPREVHLMLLDNGRSRIHQDHDMQATLACIRCGACMNHCPVYSRIGGHAYGSTYPGPIGQVITPQLTSLATAAPLVSACSLNGACGEACPVEIPLPGLIRRLRARRQQHAATQSRREQGMWRLWRWLNTHPRSYRLLLAVLARAPWLTQFGPAAWRQTRVFPKPARHTLQQLMQQRVPINTKAAKTAPSGNEDGLNNARNTGQKQT